MTHRRGQMKKLLLILCLFFPYDVNNEQNIYNNVKEYSLDQQHPGRPRFVRSVYVDLIEMNHVYRKEVRYEKDRGHFYVVTDYKQFIFWVEDPTYKEYVVSNYLYNPNVDITYDRKRGLYFLHITTFNGALNQTFYYEIASRYYIHNKGTTDNEVLNRVRVAPHLRPKLGIPLSQIIKPILDDDPWSIVIRKDEE